MPVVDCVLCRIALGALPAHVVHASKDVVAFLDIQPIRPAHVLVVPREHFVWFDAIPPTIAQEILTIGQRLAPILRGISGAERVAFLFTGIDMPHAHAHVLPMHETSDITSRRAIVEEQVTIRPMPRADDEALRVVADRVRLALAGA